MTHRDRFLYDGERIAEDDTPEKLDMEDNGERSREIFEFRGDGLLRFNVDRHDRCHGRA